MAIMIEGAPPGTYPSSCQQKREKDVKDLVLPVPINRNGGAGKVPEFQNGHYGRCEEFCG